MRNTVLVLAIVGVGAALIWLAADIDTDSVTLSIIAHVLAAIAFFFGVFA